MSVLASVWPWMLVAAGLAIVAASIFVSDRGRLRTARITISLAGLGVVFAGLSEIAGGSSRIWYIGLITFCFLGIVVRQVLQIKREGAASS